MSEEKKNYIVSGLFEGCSVFRKCGYLYISDYRGRGGERGPLTPDVIKNAVYIGQTKGEFIPGSKKGSGALVGGAIGGATGAFLGAALQMASSGEWEYNYNIVITYLNGQTSRLVLDKDYAKTCFETLKKYFEE